MPSESKSRERFQKQRRNAELSPSGCHLTREMVSATSSSGEMSCVELRRHLVDYMEGDLEHAMARRLLDHLESCAQCDSVLKGIQNVASLLSHLGEFDLPAGLRIRPISHDNQAGPVI